MNAPALPPIDSRQRLAALAARVQRLAKHPGDLPSIAIAAACVRGLARDAERRLGLPDLAALAMALEPLLLQLHRREQRCDAATVMLLLECVGHMGDLLDDGVSHDEAERRARGARLQGRLLALQGRADPGIAPPTGPQVWRVAANHWHLSLRYRGRLSGPKDDPLRLLQVLQQQGELRAVEVLDDALPSPEAFDPRDCRLGFEIAWAAPGDGPAVLLAGLGSVADWCLLPPRCPLTDYVDLLRRRPEPPTRLGERLLACASLSRLELDYALAALAHPCGPPPPSAG